MKFLAVFSAVVAVCSAGLAVHDPTEAVVQGPKVILQGAAATLAADTGAIVKSAEGTAVIAPEAHVIGGPLAAAFGPHSLSAGLSGVRSVLATPYGARIGSAYSGISSYAADANIYGGYVSGAVAPLVSSAVGSYAYDGAASYLAGGVSYGAAPLAATYATGDVYGHGVAPLSYGGVVGHDIGVAGYAGVY